MATKIKIALKCPIKTNNSCLPIKIEKSQKSIISPELEANWGKKYSEGSLKKMKEHLKRIDETIFKKGYFDIDDYLKDYEKVIIFIDSTKSQKVLCNTVRQALCFYGVSETHIGYKKYYEYFGQLVEKSKDAVNSEVVSFPEFTWSDFEERWKELDQIVNSKSKIKNNDYELYLVYSLYYFVPPLRPQDWLDSKIVDLPKGSDVRKYTNEVNNFIDLTSGQLVVSNYKTFLTHGIRVIELPPNLVKIIKKWRTLSPFDNLFTTKKGKVIEEQNFSKFWEKLLINGHKTTPTELRNLFISEKIIDANLSLPERLKYAYIMGHTLHTQTFYYSKYSKKWHPNHPPSS